MHACCICLAEGRLVIMGTCTYAAQDPGVLALRYCHCHATKSKNKHERAYHCHLDNRLDLWVRLQEGFQIRHQLFMIWPLTDLGHSCSGCRLCLGGWGRDHGDLM